MTNCDLAPKLQGFLHSGRSRHRCRRWSAWRGVTLSVFCAFSPRVQSKTSAAHLAWRHPSMAPAKTPSLAWLARSNVYILWIQFSFFGRCERQFVGKTRALKIGKFASRLFLRCCRRARRGVHFLVFIYMTMKNCTNVRAFTSDSIAFRWAIFFFFWLPRSLPSSMNPWKRSEEENRKRFFGVRPLDLGSLRLDCDKDFFALPMSEQLREFEGRCWERKRRRSFTSHGVTWCPRFVHTDGFLRPVSARILH